ncbi:RICIN domain-containing protein [Streptomyces sp. NPDC097617]|uniref:RICIN domain-containing protein n=1 Tax=Streptomyces sp. NPDC097617 TaxID=3366091 RepID=UPI00381E5C8D
MPIHARHKRLALLTAITVLPLALLSAPPVGAAEYDPNSPAQRLCKDAAGLAGNPFDSQTAATLIGCVNAVAENSAYNRQLRNVFVEELTRQLSLALDGRQNFVIFNTDEWDEYGIHTSRRTAYHAALTDVAAEFDIRYELPADFSKAKYNYHVWIFKGGGTFLNELDGGYLNWAFGGYWQRSTRTRTWQCGPSVFNTCSHQDALVTFSPAPDRPGNSAQPSDPGDPLTPGTPAIPSDPGNAQAPALPAERVGNGVPKSPPQLRPGTYTVLRNKKTGLVAEPYRGHTGNGTRIDARTRTSSVWQKWTLNKRKDGKWSLAVAASTAQVLNANNNPKRTLDGDADFAQLWAWNQGGDNKEWTLRPLAGGVRQILSHDGRCLTATTNGEPLRLRTCSASDTAQQWYLDETTVTGGPTQGGDA